MAITINKPTVGGNEGTWGDTINDGLTAIESTFNGSGTGKATVAPDLSSLTINGTPVTTTPAELNTLQGFTGSVADLNYAKDLRATGVTTTEFDKLDNLTATTAELNVMDGDTSATSTTVVSGDRVVFNDNGTMKQVSLSDINTFIQSQAGSAGNGQITIQAGTGLSGGGNFTVNQAGASTITLNASSPNNATVSIVAGTGLTGGGSFTTDQSGNSSITLNSSATSTSFNSVGSLAVGGPNTSANGNTTHSAGSNYAGSVITFGGSAGTGTWKCLSPSYRSNTYVYNDNPYTTTNIILVGLYERIS